MAKSVTPPFLGRPWLVYFSYPTLIYYLTKPKVLSFYPSKVKYTISFLKSSVFSLVCPLKRSQWIGRGKKVCLSVNLLSVRPSVYLSLWHYHWGILDATFLSSAISKLKKKKIKKKIRKSRNYPDSKVLLCARPSHLLGQPVTQWRDAQPGQPERCSRSCWVSHVAMSLRATRACWWRRARIT